MITYDKLFDMLQNEIIELEELLTSDISSMSKKEVERYARNIRLLLLATLSDPLPINETLPEHLIPLLKKTVHIRMLHTQLSVSALSELSAEEVQGEKKKHTKKVKKKAEKANQTQGEENV